MRHKELTNHIEGSFLKQQFLEAFLVQSAYIESVLKLYADYVFFEATDGNSYENKALGVIREGIGRYGLNELIKFLSKSELITNQQKSLLHSYRERRNKVMHDLLKEISRDKFEEELEQICVIGNQILDDKRFVDIANIIASSSEEKGIESDKKEDAENGDERENDTK